MLKYNDIIAKLTDAQKIRILTGVGALSGKDLKILGIPSVKVGNIKDFCRYIYPHSNVLSHSWDTELWERVSHARAEKMRSYGVNFAAVPGPKIKLSPYRRELTEDTYLASLMSASQARGAAEAKLMTGITGCYLTESDADWMDTRPQERIINEFVVHPYRKAALHGNASGVFTDTRVPSEEYKNVCRYVQDGVSGSAEFLICDRATDETTVDFVSRGIICLEGSSGALESALTKYKKLKQSIETGEGATSIELAEAEHSKTAISEEEINAALDKVLDFVFRCAEAPECGETLSAEEIEALSLRSALESTVLLKNRDRALLLNGSRGIAVIGDVAFGTNSQNSTAEGLRDAFEARGYSCTGVVRGYDVEEYPSERLTEEAVSLAKRSDTVVLFLGFSYKAEKKIPKTEKLTVPANQLYLADRISRLGKRVIAVLSAGHAPDVEFTRHFEAVLLAPLGLKYSAEALARIITGEYNPSGKLAYTLYSGSETAFAKRELYRNKYGMKSGPFIGYRYYDTAKLKVGYPFGHGLSYTEFNYSGLSIEGRTVTFTVENSGDTGGTETVEIYAGAESSAVLRPEKELVAFARVELMPGEKKRIAVDIELPRTYFGGEHVIERGQYGVYVGSSVSDIRLKGSLYAEGVTLEADGERLADYLQSVSNVTEDNYTLEADYSFMKKTVKNILFGIGSLALAISVAMFNAFTEASSVFLGVVSGILAACSIIFFIIEAVERSKRHAEDRKNIDEANEKYFEEAEQVPVLPSARMFEDEFDSEGLIDEVGTALDEEEEEENYSEFIKEDFNMSSAVREFTGFALERGYKFAKGAVESFLASLATSRLIVMNGMKDSEFFSFMLLVSEYFGSDAYVDTAVGKLGTEADQFFSYDSQGDSKKKGVLLAMDSAARNKERIHLAGLKNVTGESVIDYLAPFMRYVSSPKAKSPIVIRTSGTTNTAYNVPANLWLILNLAEGEAADKLPVNVARLAAVNNMSFSRCQTDGSVSVSHGFSSYQIEYMLEKESGKHEISEELWKKIDKIERYAASFSDYSIGNKLWLGFEKQLGLLLSCGMELRDGADAAVAVKLLPSVSSAIKGKLTKEDKTLAETLEFVMGEENIECCKKFISSLAAAQKTDTVTKTEEVNADVKEEVKVETPEAVEEAAEEAKEEVKSAPKASFCTACGAKLNEGFAFCTACGAKVEVTVSPIAEKTTAVEEAPVGVTAEENTAVAADVTQSASSEETEAEATENQITE